MEDSKEKTIDSNILNKSDLTFIEKRLKNIDIFKDKNIYYKLIYRATRDGGLPKDFHDKCDGIPNTITIIKTKKNNKFGGYITYKWDKSSQWINNDENCFIFSLDLKKYYEPIKYEDEYQFNERCGPNFSEFGLQNDLFKESSLNLHLRGEYFSGLTKDYEINGGNKTFTVEDLEVFQVLV